VSGPGTAPTWPGTAWDEHPDNLTAPAKPPLPEVRNTHRAGSANGMYNIGNTNLGIPG